MPLKLKLDLMDVLLRTETTENQKALASFVKRDSIKREFGKRVVDEIKRRTLSGKDKNDNSFSPYSKRYKESREFMIYGKSSRVNLKLTGEMQASMNVVGVGPTTVTLGFISPEQDKKATRHVLGDGVPVRDFWGISQEDQNAILKSVISDFNATEEAADLFSAVSSLVNAGIASETSGESSGVPVSTTITSIINLTGGGDG